MPPPTRSNTAGMNALGSNILLNGIATRGKRSTFSMGENQTVGKRKAESPLKKATKRSAFGDITNAIGKSATDTKKIFKNVTTTHSKSIKQKEKKTEEKSQKVDARDDTLKAIPKKKGVVAKPSVRAAVERKLSIRSDVSTRSTLSRTSSLPLVRPSILKTATAAVPSDATVTSQKPKAAPALKAASKEPVRSSARLSARLSLNSDSGETSLYVSALDIVVPDDATSAVDTTTVAVPEATRPTTPKKVLPPGVEDFDAENAHDPFQVSDYAYEIFEYLKERESKFKIGDYMEKQVNLTRYMRSLLVDWMVEVQENFELNHETLYLAVKIVDLYLSKVPVGKETLQLVGAAAMFIASKYDERIPPLVDDLTYICDGAYNPDQLISMEISILREINFDLSMPLSYRFLRRYARCAKIAMPQLTLARYILELSLMEYNIVSLSDSKLAAAALLLAMKMQNLGSWTPTLEYYSGYKIEDIKEMCCMLNDMLHKKPRAALATVRNKYSHKVFFEVATIPLVDDLGL